MLRAVTDTHTAIWYLYDDPRLSQRARTLIEEAASAGDQIGVSAITLAEIVYLNEKARIHPEALGRALIALDEPSAVLRELPLNRAVTPGGTVGPTGRRLAWTTCYFVGTRDGKMASITEYYDALSLLPPPSSFPELAGVKVRDYPGSPPFARVSLRGVSFPALATIDLMTSFPQLAAIRWEEGNDDEADTLSFRAPMMATFPDLAKCRW